MATIILVCFIGYLVGSVPFGLVFTRLAGLGDIRKIGSHNIGATNVLRTGRKDLALLTVIFDACKAGVIAFLMKDFTNNQAIGLLAGTMAILGHNYPLWLRFKGGKGVASTLGLMFFMTPKVGLIAVITWLGMACWKKYSSLSALTALALAPVFALLFYSWVDALFYLGLTLLSYYRHRENIKRLINGTESLIHLKKQEGQKAPAKKYVRKK